MFNSEATSSQFYFMLIRCLVVKVNVGRGFFFDLEIKIWIQLTLALNKINYIDVILIFEISIWWLGVVLVRTGLQMEIRLIFKFELVLIVTVMPKWVTLCCSHDCWTWFYHIIVVRFGTCNSSVILTLSYSMFTLVVDIHYYRWRFWWKLRFSCIPVNIFFLKINLIIRLCLRRFIILNFIADMILRLSELCDLIILVVVGLRIWLIVFGINIRSVNTAENARPYNHNWDKDNGGVPFLPDRIPPEFFFFFHLFWGISWNVFVFIFNFILIIFCSLFLIICIFYFLFFNYDTLYIDNFKIQHAVYCIRYTPNRKINDIIFILLKNLVLSFDRFVFILVLFRHFLLWLYILLIHFLILLFKESSSIVIFWLCNLSFLSILIVIFNFINFVLLFFIGLLLLWYEIFLGDMNFHVVYLLKFQLKGESVTFESVWAQLIVFQNELLWNLTIFCYGDFSVSALVSILVWTKGVLEHFWFVKIVDTIGACTSLGATNIFNWILRLF